MHIHIRRGLVPVFGSLALAYSLLSPAGAQHLTLTGCSSNTPPFVVTKEGKGVSGFSFELFQHVAKQMSRSADVTEMPWARCLVEVKAGRINLAIDAYEDAERRKTFLYSTPYHTLTP